MKSKVAVIGTNGLPANYGGWETLVDHLTRNLSDEVDFTVYCSTQAYDRKISHYNHSKLVYFPLNANGISSIFYDIFTMVHALFFARVFLILGVSGCIFLPFLRLFPNKKLVVNIDGIEWKRDKWGRFAKWFLRLSEKIAVRFAHEVITDNVEIGSYVKNEYGVDSTVIAYGGDHVERVLITEEGKKVYPFLTQKYAFSVCRIEPENNIHIILDAFSKVDSLPLVIVGNWRNSDYGTELKDKYSDYQHIYLIDAIYDQKKLNELRSNAFIYLHGHSVGGTNPSLVEAMNLCLPVIAFDVSYNRATTLDKAIYFKNAEELKIALQSLDSSQLDEVKTHLFALSQELYRWSVISSKYKTLFD